MSETLFDYALRAHAREFGGATYDQKRDGDRLRKQLDAVRSFMLRNGWVTLAALSAAVKAPESSVSARIRDLRKQNFGGYIIEKRHVKNGLWEYHMKVGGGT